MRVLVVEDDVMISDGLSHLLKRHGHVVTCVADGASAKTALETLESDIVLLDLGLPQVDGITVLKHMRTRQNQTPVIIMTARDDIDSRLLGLNAGADDYVVKPFEPAEIEARIRAIARRAIAGTASDLALGKLVLKYSERRFYVDERPLDLSPREYGVLEVLVSRHGRVISKSHIQDHLCNWDEELTDSAIEIYIHRIRKKLDKSDIEIRTVRGFGYLLKAKHGESGA